MISLLSPQSIYRLSLCTLKLPRFSSSTTPITATSTTPLKKMHIILDFDGTITANDTIGNLAASAVSFQTQRDAQVGSTVDWDARWKRILDDYLADHQRHKAAYAPAEPDRTSLEHELDYLRGLRDVDCGSIRAMYEAGLFKGMAAHHLAEAGQAAVHSVHPGDKVTIRPGFSEFLTHTAVRKWPVSIVSVNWSDAWIRGVVATQAKDKDEASNIKIYTNEITDAGAIVSNYERTDSRDSTNNKKSPISSCLDKLEALKVAAVHAAESSATVKVDEPVVYMGDSTTDLECLIHAGQGSHGGGGIILADGDGPVTSKLLKTLARLGYNVPHVSEAEQGLFREMETEAKGETKIEGDGEAAARDTTPRLAWARDFDEIMASRILD